MEIIYWESNKGIEKENNIPNYFDKPGVWALYGKKKDGYVCLNVGKCKAIGQEILYDVACFHLKNNCVEADRDYINQFKEKCGFKYKSGLTQEFLYPHIRNAKYEEIVFVLISKTSDSKMEHDFAWITKAKFWRNGGVCKTSDKSYYDKAKGDAICDRESKVIIESIEEVEDIIKQI